MGFITNLHTLKNGRLLAEGVLSDAPSLNALSHEMVALMLAALNTWRNDARIVAVVLRGDGDKHFCVGGNIRDLAARIEACRWQEVADFFCDEYRLDAMIYDYPKPVIGWATGGVMGGGMGIFQGCALRLATDTIKMAMPEVYIGLFADVGANWFLRRCPPPLGMFLGLSGATLTVHEARYANLMDFAMPAGGREEWMARLLAADWGDNAKDNLLLVRQISADMSLADEAAASALAVSFSEISACCRQDNAAAIVEALRQAKQPWLQALTVRLASASPAAMVFWHRYWQSLVAATKAEVFAADYRAMMAFCRDTGGEFMEGVRALLIDKDKKPQWQYADCAAVPANWPLNYAKEEDNIAAKRLEAELSSPGGAA